MGLAHSWIHQLQTHEHQQYNQDSTINPRCDCNHVFDKKSLCPGASVIVTSRLLVLDFYREIPIVIPSSAFSLSKAQAYWKERFPISEGSFSNCTMVRLSTHHNVVDWMASSGRLARVMNDSVDVCVFAFPVWASS